MPPLVRLAILFLLSLNNALSTHAQDGPLTTSRPDDSGNSRPTDGNTSNASWTTLGNATCHSRTANYITHSLPQQCLRTNRASTHAANATDGSSTDVAASSPTQDISHDVSDTEPRATSAGISVTPSSDVKPVTASASSEDESTSAPATKTASEPPVETAHEPEADTDSPLDNANFLSFEEWKRQNLAKAGQSPENLGTRSQHIDGERRRPGINNALDVLGEENEIELDFSGFGASHDDPRQERSVSGSNDAASSQTALSHQTARSKDAGKTCKERTNYASFDCAATILKNNPESKSGSAILVENKDSYMLNKCSADNKFVIVELCSDILVDTIVLANYEFFSSIFRHFRISVSDRYPVKMEKWKDLGTFEARNTREVQAFLIENPLIWARYLRIEFLSHYGNEYYCPVSLLRVHGTTMMDEFRHQEEIARGEPQDDEPVVEPEVPAQTTIPQEPSFDHSETQKNADGIATGVETSFSETTALTRHSTAAGRTDQVTPDDVPVDDLDKCEANASDIDFVQHYIFTFPSCATNSPSSVPLDKATAPSPSTNHKPEPSNASPVHATPSPSTQDRLSSEARATRSSNDPISSTSSIAVQSSTRGKTSTDEKSDASGPSPKSSQQTSNSTSSTTSAQSVGHSRDETAVSHSNKGSVPTTESTRSAPSSTSAQPAQPSTQESFFKSVHKRLQQLESNSTLSLQYIEEQSRILRDAFSKVEKRQVTATTNFLSNLNSTVMGELQGFRQAYDQLWQSTVIELEGQREQYQREMLALSTRLTLVADELVWQKRMGIVQSTLLLLCLALVLFNRAGNSALVEMPLLQQMMNKSQAALIRAGWESPPGSRSPEDRSPENRSPVSLFRKKLWRHSTEPVGGHATDDMDSRPQSRDATFSTPNITVDPPASDNMEAESEDEADWKEVPEVQSEPATPRMSDIAPDSNSWPGDNLRPGSSLSFS